MLDDPTEDYSYLGDDSEPFEVEEERSLAQLIEDTWKDENLRNES